MRFIGILCIIPFIFTIPAFIDHIEMEIEQAKNLRYNVEWGNLNNVRWSLKNGAAPDMYIDFYFAQDDGKTLLHKLCEEYPYAEEDREEIARLLIDYGADVNAVYNGHNFNSGDGYAHYENCGYTPVLFSAKKGDFDMVKLLVENGADLTVTDCRGKTVLDVFEQTEDNRELYDYLVANGAPVK